MPDCSNGVKTSEPLTFWLAGAGGGGGGAGALAKPVCLRLSVPTSAAFAFFAGAGGGAAFAPVAPLKVGPPVLDPPLAAVLAVVEAMAEPGPVAPLRVEPPDPDAAPLYLALAPFSATAALLGRIMAVTCPGYSEGFQR